MQQCKVHNFGVKGNSWYSQEDYPQKLSELSAILWHICFFSHRNKLKCLGNGLFFRMICEPELQSSSTIFLFHIFPVLRYQADRNHWLLLSLTFR